MPAFFTVTCNGTLPDPIQFPDRHPPAAVLVGTEMDDLFRHAALPGIVAVHDRQLPFQAAAFFGDLFLPYRSIILVRGSNLLPLYGRADRLTVCLSLLAKKS